MRAKSIISVIFLSTALAACGTVESVSGWMSEANFSSSSIDCEERTARQLSGVDFATAAHIEMVVRNSEFSPMVVRLTKGRSYVFRLRNRDDETHTFDAPEFFGAIAVAAVAMDNTIIQTVCPGPVVRLKGGQSFEMQFLAAQDGSYTFTDTANGIGVGGLLGTGAPGGVIWIEEIY